MRITRDEAQGWFSETIPAWMDYRAEGGACMAFHESFWPGVAMVHLGANPRWWGALDGCVASLLREYWDDAKPKRIVAWVPARNRAVLAMARRVGFTVDGQMPLPDGEITMIGWTG